MKLISAVVNLDSNCLFSTAIQLIVKGVWRECARGSHNKQVSGIVIFAHVSRAASEKRKFSEATTLREGSRSLCDTSEAHESYVNNAWITSDRDTVESGSDDETVRV